MVSVRGFSLVELLLTISISLVIGALVFPMSVSYLRSEMIETSRENMVSIVRKAHFQARHLRHDSAFGVRFLTDRYVLFEGGSYGARNTSEDQEFPLAGQLEVSGVTEVVFEKGTGDPNIAGNLTLSAHDKTRTITIEETGNVY